MRNNLIKIALIIMFSTSLHAKESIDELMNMSIEQLMNITVTSVSKKEEKAFEAPAAIYVLTGEDIKRLGATSIPEALRAVPGLQVAQSGSSDWAVSSRGFNGRFANKLLVLVDGRTVYTPLYSGVYWDTIDYLLEDIDRIEVIRGPGATLWGSNAVNGVINIITKKAEDTQGTYAKALAGNHETGTASARYGGKTENGHYRAYGKFAAKNNSEFYGEKINDDWVSGKGGFRLDTKGNKGNKFTLQGDVYLENKGSDLILPEITAPYYSMSETTEKVSGANILGRWSKKLSDVSDISTQVYVDYARRDSFILDQQILTTDIEFQHIYEGFDKHQLIWGAGARAIYDDLEGSFYVNYTPDTDTIAQFNTFIEDKITLIPEKLFLTIGTKFEWNEYTDFELQPSARLGWNINEDNFAWASVSRAVRTPNRTSNTAFLALQGMPPGVMVSLYMPNTKVELEELIAYEMGYRKKFDETLFFDVSLFYNDYDKLGNMGTDGAIIPLNGIPVLPYYAIYNDEGNTYGGEISADWKVNDNWNLYFNYSYLKMDLKYGTSMINTESKNPQHQFNIRSHLNFAKNWEMDNILYYVDEISDGTTDIDNYIRFDTRLAYKPNKNWEFSIVGQNLFDDWHQEFFPFQYQQSAEVGRSVYGSIIWKF